MKIDQKLYEEICNAIDDSKITIEEFDDACNCFTCTGTCEDSCSGTCNNTCNATCTENCRSGFGSSYNNDSSGDSGW